MGNRIHPSAVLDGQIELGDDNTIGPFVVISGPVFIGDGNFIGAGAVLGALPEVRSFPHVANDAALVGLTIGSRNVIREHAQIHGGLREATRIGSDCFIMNQSYVAHDGRIGDNVTIASSALLAGHVAVGDFANLGLGVHVHQYRSIGAGAMVGMGSVVTRDVMPFSLVYGSPARMRGANRVGLQRAGVDDDVIATIHRAYERGDLSVADEVDLPSAISRYFR